MADRVYMEDSVINSVIANLDEKDILKIYSEGRHPKTFTFAMALGAGIGERTPLNGKTKGWLQYSAINNSDSENRSYATSLALNEFRKEGQDNLVSEEDNIFSIATEYANAGFKMIHEMIPDFDNYDEDDFIYQLIAMMDDKYEEIQDMTTEE